MPLIRFSAAAVALAVLLLLPACSPALDWRDVRLAETPLHLTMPCRPDAQSRQIQLAGQSVLWRLQVCSAGDLTFAVAWADLGSPALLGPALKDLSAAAAGNISATSRVATSWRVPGATPHEASQRVRLEGARSDGQTVQMEVAVFTYGTAVFQATVLAPRVAPAAAEPFFDALRFRP